MTRFADLSPDDRRAVRSWRGPGEKGIPARAARPARARPRPGRYSCLRCGHTDRTVAGIERHIDREHGGARYEQDLTLEG